MPKPLTDFETEPLLSFTERAYLDYSMYVILDRALPFVGDGLKPVQRRIVYAMSELGLSAAAKFKKSARTVGDVIGKFHPHGDSACYEAMVLMAQPFSYRYPLIDGQGNWGSQDDPKSFAAMRYTESKLTPYAAVLLGELGQGTVDWGPNFDGTMEEPQWLPAQVPNVLLNGGSGIAVGMATDIPPHNLTEVVKATVALLQKTRTPLQEILKMMPAPDFPTGGEIVNSREEIEKIYTTGTGSLRLRAVFHEERGNLVVTELPYQVSGAKVQEQIAAQMRAKKLPLVENLVDESDRNAPIRLVIVPRSSRVDRKRLMEHLFATTDLERSVRVNMNMIGVDGLPRVFDLKELLLEWLSFRTATLRRRLEWRLDKVRKRLHILEGYLVAFLNIDEVIHIIRTEDDPKAALIARFELSEIQAEAILELRLRQIAKLEEIKIRGEQEALEAERNSLEQTLGSDRRLKTLLRKELEEVADKLGDDRRTRLITRPPATAMDESELTPAEPITVVLSRQGWVRAGKGHEVDATALNYRSGDALQATAPGKSNQTAVFLDNTGRCYSLPAHLFPSARSLGEPLTGRLSPPDGSRFVDVYIGEPGQQVLAASSAGYGFVAGNDDLVAKTKSGKALLSVPAGFEALPFAPFPLKEPAEACWLVAVSSDGYLLALTVHDVPAMAKGKGNKLVQVPKPKSEKDAVRMVGTAVLGPKDTLRVHSGQRYTNLSYNDLYDYQGERGRRGVRLPRGYQKVAAIEILRKGQS